MSSYHERGRERVLTRIGRFVRVSIVVDESFSERNMTAIPEATTENRILVVDTSIDNTDLLMKGVCHFELSEQKTKREGEKKTHSDTVSENTLLMKFVHSSHNVRRENIVLVIFRRVSNSGVVGEVRDVFARRVAISCIYFVNWFWTRYDSNWPSTLWIEISVSLT